MTKQPVQTVSDAPAPTPATDPTEALCTTLFSTEEGAEKTAARRTVGGMTQRPWQQLPGKLRRAIRADIRRLRDAKLSGEEIAAKGYGRAIADQALRDIGHGGA